MSYSPASPATTMLIDRVLKADHSRLRRMRWSAISVDRRVPCPGPAWAVITSPAVRACGTSDVILHLDATVWNEADSDTQRAWIDFVLSGLALVERNGSLVVDGSGQPIVRKVRPPISVQLFPNVVARHGRNAFDPQAVNEVLSLAISAGCWDLESERRATRRSLRTASHSASAVIK